MEYKASLFLGTFMTLLAMINPLEALPVFLGLLEGRGTAEHKAVARRSCLYATVLMVFFTIFGTLVPRIFGVPLSMVRIVGGLVLLRIGFNMFLPQPGAGSFGSQWASGQPGADIAFVPLAMPIMFGPGTLATVLGMSSNVSDPFSHLGSIAAILAAVPATMVVTYLILVYAEPILERVGPKGIDAATRLVGFFVSAMGMGLVFHGAVEAFQTYGIAAAK